MLIDILFNLLTGIVMVVTIESFNEFYSYGGLLRFLIFAISLFMWIGGFYLSVEYFNPISTEEG